MVWYDMVYATMTWTWTAAMAWTWYDIVYAAMTWTWQ